MQVMSVGQHKQVFTVDDSDDDKEQVATNSCQICFHPFSTLSPDARQAHYENHFVDQDMGPGSYLTHLPIRDSFIL